MGSHTGESSDYTYSGNGLGGIPGCISRYYEYLAQLVSFTRLLCITHFRSIMIRFDSQGLRDFSSSKTTGNGYGV